MNAVYVKCPACPQGMLMIQPRLLLSGAEFCCYACGASLSLVESECGKLRESLEAIERIKCEASHLDGTDRILI